MGDKADFFRGLRGKSILVRDRFVQSLRPKIRRQAEKMRDLEIAIHVRRGDFIAAGWNLTPEEHFIDAIEAIRNRCGNQKVTVFSDAKPESFPQIMKLANLEFHPTESDAPGPIADVKSANNRHELE